MDIIAVGVVARAKTLRMIGAVEKNHINVVNVRKKKSYQNAVAMKKRKNLTNVNVHKGSIQITTAIMDMTTI